MVKTILITGGSGFIAHHVVQWFLLNSVHNIVTLDRLDLTSTMQRLADVIRLEDRGRVRTVWHDLKAPINDTVRGMLGHCHIVLHMAASTHVDRSIVDPMSFVMDNVVGTTNMLEFARSMPNLERFIYFSTDEVFGPALPDRTYAEWDRYDSRNPYAASKAGAEEMCLAYRNTYNLPIQITHCMNVFGERQHIEKFIPSTIRKIIDHKKITIHADASLRHPGSRFYIHAKNVANAISFILHDQQAKEIIKLNIVGEQEIDNLKLVQRIARIMDRNFDYELVDFHGSRPGHDLRYALSGKLMADMGWKIPSTLDQSLKNTVQWFMNNPKWLGF